MNELQSGPISGTLSYPLGDPLPPPSLLNGEATPTQPRIVETATAYRERGWVPIPLRPRTKQPKRPGWQTSTLQTSLGDFEEGDNVGILLGDASGGLVDIDLDCPEAIKAAPALLPPTGMTFGHRSKPKSHWLYVVPQAGKSERFSSEAGMVVEYRSNGSQTVFPPSVHTSGEPIEWEGDDAAAIVTAKELHDAVAALCVAVEGSKYWTGGRRHQVALALAGALCRSGWSQYRVNELVGAICELAHDEEFLDRFQAVEDTFGNFERGLPTTGWPELARLIGEKPVGWISHVLGIQPSASALANRTDDGSIDPVKLTDIGNAQRFYEQNKAEAAFCTEQNAWFLWADRRWEKDGSNRIVKLGEKTARSILEEASHIENRREREDCVKWANRSCSKSGIDNMIGLAKSDFHVPLAKFDQSGMLLNCLNGTVDLRTGQLRRHDRSDYLTVLASVEFDPSAKCPRFEAFLNQVTGSDAELSGFIQRALGYSLTGSTEEQCLFIAHGEGANGKSTLLNLFRNILGDGYARNTPVHTFIRKRADGAASGDLVRLRGCRFATIMEAEQDQKMAEALLKQFTGGDAITARAMYSDYIDFTPEAKLWLATNHKPRLSADDDATWRRIRLIPFNVVIPPDERDPKLPAKLRSEASGILAWAVRGCLEWQRNGLRAPAVVSIATDAYKEEVDDVRQFVKDCLVPTMGAKVEKDEMYDAYDRWARSNATDKLTKSAFGRRMKKAGIEEGKSGSRYWKNAEVRWEDQGTTD